MTADHVGILKNLASRNPAYAQFLPPSVAAQVRAPAAQYHCAYRGTRTGERRECLDGCKQGSLIPLQQCDLFGVCSVAISVGPDVRVCKTCAHRIEQLPIRSGAPMPHIWSYGLTTVLKRRDSLLPRTLANLKTAGFDSPRLFVDDIANADAPSWEREFGLEVTPRSPRIRTFGNWVLGLAELYIRNPNATRYAMFQDDFVTYRNLQGYLDRVPFPGGAYLNLYTFPRNQAAIPAGSKDGFYPAAGRGLGAVALVFTRDGVRDLLTQQHTVDRPMDPVRGHRQIDGGVWNAMLKAGYKELVHSPSLVQHIGLKSTMSSPGDNHDNQALAPSFRGEEYDALAMLPEPVPVTAEQRDAWEVERIALELAIREDVVRMDRAENAAEKTKFRGHIDRYKAALIRHAANAPG